MASKEYYQQQIDFLISDLLSGGYPVHARFFQEASDEASKVEPFRETDLEDAEPQPTDHPSLLMPQYNYLQGLAYSSNDVGAPLATIEIGYPEQPMTPITVESLGIRRDNYDNDLIMTKLTEEFHRSVGHYLPDDLEIRQLLVASSFSYRRGDAEIFLPMSAFYHRLERPLKSRLTRPFSALNYYNSQHPDSPFNTVRGVRTSDRSTFKAHKVPQLSTMGVNFFLEGFVRTNTKSAQPEISDDVLGQV